MIAIQPKSRQILGVNQQSYQALKASMSLNLRRQLLIAVCDSVVLQNQLATQLENDLAQETWYTPRVEGGMPRGISLALERLTFDPEDAHLPRQVAHWVRQTTLADGGTFLDGSLPQLQVLGIEQMTRQPAIIQNHFLRSLEQVEALLPRLNTSLLVWLPWPWLRTIQSSAPTFWKWRNAVFEFVSDPTPALLASEQVAETRRLEANRSTQSIGHRDVENLTEPLAGDSSTANWQSANWQSANWQANVEPSENHSEQFERSDFGHSDRPNSDRSNSDLSEQSELSANNYPPIDVHQVIALYGETDESDISEDDQLVLESIATWDALDVTATLVESEADDSVDLLTAATSALNAQQLETQSAEDQTTEIQQLEAQQLEAQQLEAQVAETQRLLEEKQAAEAARAIATQKLAAAEIAAKETTEPVSLPERSATPNTFDSPLAPTDRAQQQSAADDYFEVGHSYRRRIENGERGLDLIEPAIAAYEGGLRCLSGPHPDWGSGLNDLGTLYWLKAQQLSDQQQVIDCMNHSVELYSEALTKIDPDQDISMACQLHSNLGAVYSMLATQVDPVEHFQQAAEAYIKALPLCSLESDPEEFATLQNSLGSVYWKLSHYEQDKDQMKRYLQQAIAAYEQALLGYNPEQRPLDYAAVQNNLGITHWSLAKHAMPIEALKNAIAAYRDALNYRTPDSEPAACAITYNNLALAYWDLSKDEMVDAEYKIRYQRNAVTAFEAALQTASSVNSLNQADSAAIYHCLGDVHAQMVETAPSLQEVAESLQKSLYSYVQAIEGLSSDSPIFQARLSAIVANLRSHQEHLGLASQQAALNRVPPHLLSQIMQAL